MRGTWIALALPAVVVGCAGCGLFDDDDPSGDGVGGYMAPCDEPRDCREGLVCMGGQCLPGGTQLEGGACELTGDCVDGLYCNANRVCAPAGEALTGERCATTGDCARGLVCTLQGFFARCLEPGDGDIGESCGADLDCLAGLSCAPGMSGGTVCQSIDHDVDEVPPLPPPWDGAVCPAAGDTPRALFEVPRDGVTSDDFFALPFPNDVRRHPDGLDLSGFPTPSTLLAVDVMGRYVDAAEQDLRGFGTNPVVFFRFTEPYMGIGGATVEVVDLDRGQPVSDVSWLTVSGRISNYACSNLLAISTKPGHPLQPDTTYAVLLLGSAEAAGGTAEITTSEGEPFERSPDLEALLADTEPSDPDLAAAWPEYAPLRQHLADNPDLDVLNATVFSTQAPEALMPALHEVIRDQGPPEPADLTLCDEGVVSPCDDGTAERACGPADDAFAEIHGRLALPIFQQGTPPYESPEDGGGIETDETSVPLVARTEEVCFALTVPKGASMPAEGWPLVVHAHGTGGSFRSSVTSGMAGELATGSEAAATLTIDLPQHGRRRGGSDLPPEELFYNFANPRAARDNVVQGAADLMSVAHAAQDLELDAGASPTGDAVTVDPSRVLLFAHSQGATHASLMLPYEPLYLATVLSGNGGDLTESLLTKTEPVDVQALLPAALMDANADGDLHLGGANPALAIWQMFLEPADPVNHARRLHRDPIPGDPGRHVLMTYGTGDTFSTERTMTAFTLAARLPIVEPLVPGSVLAERIGSGYPTLAPPASANVTLDGADWTLGVRQYEPATGVEGHFVATQDPDGRADVLRFLRGAAGGAAPAIGE
ncbi:MAG: hypothetical protein ACODAU_13080 [Myxococcota bacterium]